MSLLNELAQNGVSAEDLEKAAHVRLFEKVAADEGIDFNQLTDDQINTLFVEFMTNVLPQLQGEAVEAGEGAVAEEPKTASYYDQSEKVASTILFEKLAADEGIDLSQLSQEDLNALYAHFLENVIPQLAQPAPAEEEVKEAQAKLAEADYIGRYMAHSYVNELSKIAEEAEKSEEEPKKKGWSTGKKIGVGAGAAAGSAGLVALGLLARRALKNRAAKGGPPIFSGSTGATLSRATAAPMGLGGMVGLGGTDLKQASAPLFDKLATDRANEILEANGVGQAQAEQPEFDDLVTARAIEILQANGYTFE
jgi:hypothetical protein